jgi:hypothetical protein
MYGSDPLVGFDRALLVTAVVAIMMAVGVCCLYDTPQFLATAQPTGSNTTELQTNPVIAALERKALQVGVYEGVAAGKATEPNAAGTSTLTWATLDGNQQQFVLGAVGDNAKLVQIADTICGGAGSTTPRWPFWRTGQVRMAVSACDGGGYALIAIIGWEGQGGEP